MSFPDYYALLGVAQNATADQIRQAYKRESLRSHPDRIPTASPHERQAATEKFQAVADAYYILSDPARRKDYDHEYATRSFTDRTAEASASDDFFANFARMFTGAGAAGSGTSSSTANAGTANEPHGQRPDPNHVFGDVFEELLRPEIHRTVPIWTLIGALSGAGIGFIIANLPGLLAGALAGNRLGAIRDAKGKSVASVFAELPGGEKAAVLRALAMKILGTTLT